MSMYGSGQGDYNQPQQPGGYGGGGGDYGQSQQPQYGQGGQGDYGQPQQPGYPPISPSVYEGSPPPPKKKSKVPLIIGIVVAVIVLVCGGGLVWFLNKAGDAVDDANKQLNEASSQLASTPSAPAGTSSAKPGSTPTDETVTGDDLDKFKKGDCLTLNDVTNEVKAAKCTDKNAYKVLLRKDGTTSETACASVDAEQILYQEAAKVSDQLVLCIAKVKK
jgi:hypothetical protein